MERSHREQHDFATFLTPSVWSQTMQALHRAAGSTLNAKCTPWSGDQTGVSCDATLQMPKFKLDYQKDLTDIPANIKDEFTIHFVESMDEVLKVALTHAPTPLIDNGSEEVPFRPPVDGDGDLQESIMH